MTLDEAKKIAAIIATTDGGCAACVDYLTWQMAEAFPEFVWRMDDDGREPVVIVEPK